MDVLQSVVNGSDGCVFAYGHSGLGNMKGDGFFLSQKQSESDLNSNLMEKVYPVFSHEECL